MTSLWPFGDLPRERYRVILVDPPTKFSSGPNRNPINHYKTMTVAEIAALPIGKLAHPDGVSLDHLPATAPHARTIGGNGASNTAPDDHG